MLDRLPLILMRTALVAALLVTTYLATTQTGTDMAPGINDKFAHLIAFFGLAWLADFSFPRARFGPGKILPLVSYGLLIELIQHFLPYRTFSLLDFAADAIGIALYGATLLLISRHPIVGWRRIAIRD